MLIYFFYIAVDQPGAPVTQNGGATTMNTSGSGDALQPMMAGLNLSSPTNSTAQIQVLSL